MTKNKVKSTLKSIFSMKTARFIGNSISRMLRWLNVTHKTAMWIFGILTLLLIWGLIGSVMSIIALEGFVVLPLIGGIIKLVLLVGTVFGWGKFWIANQKPRRGKDVTDTTNIAYNTAKKKQRKLFQDESRIKSKTSRSSGKKYR